MHRDKQSSYGFLFPKGPFRLLHGSTIGYCSDNVFYRLNMSTGQAELFHHPQGRSYQAYTTNHKRSLLVMSDYGSQASIYFEFLDRKDKSFVLSDVCPLEILMMELSLDCKYLAVVCGSPTFRLLLVDVELQKIVSGAESSLDLRGNIDSLLRVDFNPGNRKTFSLLFTDTIEVYDIKDSFELGSDGVIAETISIFRRSVFQPTEGHFETMVWDQINNIYVSSRKRLQLFSTDTNKEVLQYDIEVDCDEHGPVVSSVVLTLKHVILFYANGRIEWLLKYYPDLMEEEQASKRPFSFDKFLELQKPISHALYDHYFDKLLLSHTDGFFSVLAIQAETNQADEEEEEHPKKNKEKSKKIELDVDYLGPYHTTAIILIREIEHTPFCLTVSCDGRFMVWSLKQKRVMHFHDCKGQVSSADINSKGNVLVLGLDNGIVRLYSIAALDKIYSFKELKMTHGSRIDQLLFSTIGDQLAVLSKAEDRIYYLLVNLLLPIQVLGFVNLPANPKHICWNNAPKVSTKPRYEYLLVCIGYGILMVNGPAATPNKKRGKELELQCEINALRTDLSQQFVGVLPTGELISTGLDKLIKKYKQPQEPFSKVDFKSKAAIPPPLEQLQAHDLPIVCWQVARNFVSGSADGTVNVRQFNHFTVTKKYRVQGWRQTNLQTVHRSASGNIYVGAADGCFQVWGNYEGVWQDNHKVEPVSFTAIDFQTDLKHYQTVIEEEHLSRMKDIISNKKKLQFEKLKKIKFQLQTLLAENQNNEELQKLSRDEFAIDLESRALVEQKGKQRCLKIREESKNKILGNQVFAKKLKMITWDRMDVHLKAINGLKNNYIIYNYQLRKVSTQEKRKVQLILNLRKAQRKEARKLSANAAVNQDIYRNKNVVNGGIIQPLILSAADKKDEKKDDKAKKKKEEDVQPDKVQQEEIFNEEQWGLLYSSFELFSDNAKRNQIIMMQSLILRIKEAFNKEFEKLMKLRQSQNELINDKNKRIVEICEQLKRPSEALIGKKNILESSEHILEVRPHEIPFARYLSKEERDKLEKERQKEEARLRKLAEDDASQRALQKMMGGTLEEKKTSVLEMNVEREKWMDKPLEQMSDQEKMRMKEYEVRKMKNEEEKERIVKKLEAELRKLKLEIQDIMERYDERLFALMKRRIEYDYRIKEQQLYCARLFLSIFNVKESAKRQEQLQRSQLICRQRSSQLERQKQDIVRYKEELQTAKENKRTSLDVKRLGDIESKIKTIEKSIFEDYQSNVKKRRETEEKLLEAEPYYRQLIVPLDPLRDIESKTLSSEKSRDFNYFLAEIKVMQQAYDIPEASLLQMLQTRFRARQEEASYEQKLKHLQNSLTQLEEKISEEQQAQQRDERQLKEIEQFLQQSKSDIQVQCRIKQGQVQINNDKPVPELSEALLLHRGEIEEKNQSIISHANQKIEVMELIKTCKISVTEETLNLQKKEQLIAKQTGMIKEIQMLKVKKQMQVALAKKDTKINENELRCLKEQIEKVRKEGDKRMELFHNKIEKVAHEIEAIRKENKNLETQRWNLEATVKQREKIKDMMCGENGDGDQEVLEKFEQIAVNRKLFDKAKQQTQEIELLREELSKLKSKTFANFSNVQR